MRKSTLVLILAGVLSLASCKNSPKDKQNQSSGAITGISLSQSEMEVQRGKRSSDVTVTLDGEGEFNKTVKISSENVEIAYANFTEVESGQTFKVCGKAFGETKINLCSVEDETKATSLSVKVKEKEVVVISEIQSVSLSQETKLFYLGDGALPVTVTVNGRGTFDDSVTISLTENPTVTVDKTEVKSGEVFNVTPTSLGETTITVTSKQDTNKIASLVVRVDQPITPPAPQPVQVGLDCASHTLTLGDVFSVSANAKGGDIVWTTEENGGNYIEIVNNSTNNEGAQVRALAVTPADHPAKLVATVTSDEGTATASCNLTVVEPPKEFHTYYVTNNSYLSYAEIYFYAWNENAECNADWPGVKLENPVQNVYGEDCYEFEVDVLKFHNFKFNNGLENSNPDFNETVEGSFNSFGSNDNVWFDPEGIHFATLELDEPTISFGANSVVSIYNGTTETFSFICRKGNALYEVVSGAEFIDNIVVTNGSIKVTGAAVGEASIRVYIEDGAHNVLSEDTITIKVLDATGLTELYFTNNKNWSEVYLYAWNDNTNKQTWPGEKLDHVLKNDREQDVYSFHINTTIWKNVIFNNGSDQQTTDISLENPAFGENNNVYVLDTFDDEGHYEVGFATFTELTYSLSFVEDEVTVHSDKDLIAYVHTNGYNVSYSVTTGVDKVQIVKFNGSCVYLRYLSAGEATVTATLGELTATLVVHCEDSSSPVTTETLYFSNNKFWEDVYLYTWGAGGVNHAWPGIELTNFELNEYNEEVYDFELDPQEWSNFIINNGNNQQTVDISLADEGFDTHNNIYLVGDNSPFGIGFADHNSAPQPASVAFAVDEVTVYSGENETVSVTAQHGTGVAYAVTTGSEYVEIVNYSDSSVELHWLAEGTAVITATLDTASDTLTVNCASAAIEMVTVHFTNNIGATTLVAKTYNSAVTPDPDLSTGYVSPTSSYVNEAGQTVCAFHVNKASDDKIVFFDAGEPSNRTEAITLSSATNASAWYGASQVPGCWNVGSWEYTENRTIYLNADTHWDVDDALMYIYYFDTTNGIDGTGIAMTPLGNHIFSASIPRAANDFIFVRMANDTVSFNWSKCWNQTDDLHWNSSYNQYNITDNSGTKASGTWSNFVI